MSADMIMRWFWTLVMKGWPPWPASCEFKNRPSLQDFNNWNSCTYWTSLTSQTLYVPQHRSLSVSALWTGRGLSCDVNIDMDSNLPRFTHKSLPAMLPELECFCQLDRSRYLGNKSDLQTYSCAFLVASFPGSPARNANMYRGEIT